MVAGTSCRHAGKVLRDAGNFLYGYSTGAVKLADMPASCRHLNRERIALERFLLAGMRWISKFAGSGFAGMPWPSLGAGFFNVGTFYSGLSNAISIY